MPTTINPSDQTITQYNIQTGGASNLLNNVAPSATSGVPLISQGAASQPVFGTVLVAGGGTGAATLTGVLIGNGTSAVTGNAVTQYDILVGGASNAISSVGPGSAGQVLQSAGNAANPAYSTATYPTTATGTGTILRADGTNFVPTTATFPTTAGTSGNVLTSDGTNWASSTPAGGSNLVLIQSQNGGAVTVIDFTTGTNVYKTHLLVWRNYVPQTDDRYLELQVSTDGGSNWVSSGYTSGINYSAYNSATLTNTNVTSAFLLSASVSNVTLNGASGFVYIYGANATTKCFCVGACAQSRGAGTGTYYNDSVGNSATASVNAFRLLLNGSGNITEGNFTLFGIKET